MHYAIDADQRAGMLIQAREKLPPFAFAGMHDAAP
jgi:hypothetical protein